MRTTFSLTRLVLPSAVLALTALASVASAADECSTDTDCGGTKKCITQTSGSCGGSTGAGGGTDPTPVTGATADAVPSAREATGAPDDNCTTTTEKVCVEQWEAPCQADADCGAGFTCEKASCGCTSTGTGTVSPGDPSEGDRADAADVSETDCTCDTTEGEGYCSLKPTECTTASQCPAGWDCLEAPTGGDVPVTDNTSSPEPGTATRAVSGKADTGTAGKSFCVPQGYTGVPGGVGNETPTDEALGGTKDDTDAPETGGDDDGSDTEGDDDGGCSVGSSGGAGAAAGVALGWLALGFVGLGLRRRRR